MAGTGTGGGYCQDRRGMGMALPVGGGIGGLVLLLLFSMLTGQNPIDIITTPSPGQTTGTCGVPGDDPQAEFVSVCSKTPKTSWSRSSRSAAPTTPADARPLHGGYPIGVRRWPVGHGPVLLPERPQGLSGSVVLPGSRNRFGAPGDFAQAYVVAHEVGHHVQTVTGLSDRIARARQSEASAKQMRSR